MNEYLKILLIIPNILFYSVKFTSIAWLLICLFLLFFFRKKDKDSRLLIQFLCIFFLNFSQRFYLSQSNFYMNTPEVYRINHIEIFSYFLGLSFIYYFFVFYKINKVKNNKLILFLMIFSFTELSISALNLFLEGYGF